MITKSKNNPDQAVLDESLTEKPKASKQSLGGKARSQKLNPEKRREIAQNAAEARWEKAGGLSTFKATHEGELSLGTTKIKCAVLENGTRVVTSASMMAALGRPWKGTYKHETRPNFISGGNLDSFIDDNMRSLLTPVEYRMHNNDNNEGRSTIRGYRAELLPAVCEVYLKARDEKKLLQSQEGIAKAADMIIRGLAQVGIVALVDEATGYQEVRDRLALQKIIDKFLSKELAAWAKRFPDEFYQQLFRLKGWTWKHMTSKRTPYIGRLTNDLVYERLAPGILEELKKKNPKTETGHRKHKHHQWLTDDIGHPALAQHMHSTVAFMRASSNWSEFYRLMSKALPKKSTVEQISMDLGEA